MEQLKTTNHPPNTPPNIRVRLQTGATNSVDVSSAGVEPEQVCSTIEYLAQSSLKASQELEKLHYRNSALFIVCITLILASSAFAIAFSVNRYASAIIQEAQHEQN